MLEKRVSLTPEEAYQELKNILLTEGAKIIAEYPPKRIIVEQGSWFWYSPKTHKKIIRFDFIAEEAGTRIVSDTSWPLVAISVTILTDAVLGIIILFEWLLYSNLKAYITGYADDTLFSALGLLLYIAAGLLFLNILMEAYCYAKRETAAERFLSLMPQSRFERATP